MTRICYNTIEKSAWLLCRTGSLVLRVLMAGKGKEEEQA